MCAIILIYTTNEVNISDRVTETGAVAGGCFEKNETNKQLFSHLTMTAESREWLFFLGWNVSLQLSGGNT